MQKATAAIKSLQAAGLQEVLKMRAMVTLHTSVRTPEGASILSLLPYSLHGGLAPSAADKQEVVNYLESHQMSVVLRKYQELLEAVEHSRVEEQQATITS